MAFTEIEQKLIRLMLNPASEPGEITNSAIMLAQALRKRKLDAEAFIKGVISAPQPQAQATGFKAPDPDLAAYERALKVRMTFGKHRGLTLGEIPFSYIAWMDRDCENLSPMLKAAIRIVLKKGYN